MGKTRGQRISDERIERTERLVQKEMQREQNAAARKFKHECTGDCD